MALSFTIGPHNYLDLPKVFDLATDLGLGLAYRCVQTSPIYYGTQRAEEGWSEEQLEELERSLRVMEQRVYAQQSSAARLVNLNRFYNEMMLEYERRPRRLHECYSGSESVFIDAYGNVFPCIIRDGSFGSVKEAPFDDIWTSEKAESTRQSIARHDCHCWVDCEVNPAISRDPRAYVRNLRHVI
jgi:radical SAM protein with 4Fe4S-binding SPASM domain